jgi:hypothetical protein
MAAIGDPNHGSLGNSRRKTLLGPSSKKVPVAIASLTILLRIIRGPLLSQRYWHRVNRLPEMASGSL